MVSTIKPDKESVCYVGWLSILLICIIGSAIGLSMCIAYGYSFNINNYYRSASCNIDACTLTNHECCNGKYGSKHKCWSCPSVAITYTLWLNETSYTKSYPDGKYKWMKGNEGVCYNQFVDCNYDLRDINGTLSLDELPPPTGPSVGIALIVLLIFVLLVSLIVVLCCYMCRVNANPNDETNENSEL